MSGIISFQFLLFCAVSLCIYYLTPQKVKWITLLIVSLTFFILVSGWKTIPYLAIGVIVSWMGARLIEHRCETKAQKKWVVFATIALLLLELLLLKYRNDFDWFLLRMGRLFNTSIGSTKVSLLVPLGISYYTMSLIGYVVDVYRKTCESQPNILKHALFTCYFPQMISGPITRYNDVSKQFFAEHHFSFETVRNGLQRMLWGYFKKLVIADRLAIYVNAVYADPATYNGFYIFVAVILFAFQLYTDFSGNMDIILGVSECFDIKLPENFKNPWFSQSFPEFWRRWHITLGQWLKDYIFYPFLKNKGVQKLTKKLNKRVGRNISRKIITAMALSILWTLIGLWHGGTVRFIVAAGIMPGFYIVMSDWFSPSIAKFTKKCNMRTESFSFRLFRSLRTFAICCSFWVLLPAQTFTTGLFTVKSMFHYNPEVLFNGAIFQLGLDAVEFFLAFVFLLVVLVVEVLQVKGIAIRESLANQSIIFRWGIMYMLIFTILIFGIYGPSYNATDFIYAG